MHIIKSYFDLLFHLCAQLLFLLTNKPIFIFSQNTFGLLWMIPFGLGAAVRYVMQTKSCIRASYGNLIQVCLRTTYLKVKN